MTHDGNGQSHLEKTFGSETDASDDSGKSAIASNPKTPVFTGPAEASTTLAGGHDNKIRGLLHHVKELDPVLRFLIGLITLFSLTAGILSSLERQIVSPGPQMEKTTPLIVGNTAMSSCLLRNNGSASEKEIWITLRAEPNESYEISFHGAEGFARLRENGGQDRGITESDVVLIQGAIARLEFERLVPRQAIVIAIKHPQSISVSCEITGSSGSIGLPGIRVLSNSDYLILISLFIVTAFSIIAASEFMRRRAEKQGFREPNINMDSTKNQGDS